MRIQSIFTILLFTLCIFLFWMVFDLQKEIKDIRQSSPQVNGPVESPHHDEEHFEVAAYMTRFQLYAEKLFWAGKNNNKELVDFYLHELEEGMEEIVEEDLIEDGIPISEHMKTMGLNQLELFRDNYTFLNFEEKYSVIIQNCNNCHAITHHEFIKIKLPTSPSFTNQEY